MKKRQAAAAALGSKGSTPDTAYLPIRLSANGMSAVLYASFLYSLPDLIGCFSFKAQLWTTKILIQSRWFPLWYGVFVFGCGLVHFGDASPKNMSNYLTAVRFGCSISKYMVQWCLSLPILLTVCAVCICELSAIVTELLCLILTEYMH